MLSSRHITLLSIGLAIALGATLCPWIPGVSPFIDSVEGPAQDTLLRAVTPSTPRAEIVVLGIDDASLETRSAFDEDVAASPTLQAMKMGFPWSRRVYADAAEKLLSAGASCVILDLILPGPSASAPEDDALLAQAIARHPGRIILGASFSSNIDSSTGQVTPLLQFPWDGLIPEPQYASRNFGFINYWPDSDDVVRSARFRWSVGLEANKPQADLPLVPSLITAAIATANPDTPIPSEPKQIRFSDPAAYPPLTVHEIFVPDLWKANFGDGAVFKDKIVFIGPAAPHMQDFHMTPLGRLLGVQVHAHVLGAVLNGDYISPAPGWVRVALITLASLLAAGLVAILRRPMTVTLLLFVLGGLGCVIAWFVLDRFCLQLPVVTPALAFLLTGLLGQANDFRLERKQRLALRSTLTRYFSPDMANELLRDPEGFHKMAKGTNRTITVLFSDLRGFTTLSEQLPPEQIVHQLKQYFDKMVEVVFGHRGSIDKFIGDAIMAVWGRLGTDQSESGLKEDALHAVRTAIRMKSALDELNVLWVAEGRPALAIGIGVHQGPAIVGDLGATARQEFTAIGDTVNTAARLESATKQYHVDILISETVRAHIEQEIPARTADLVQVKGKSNAVGVYTVVESATAPGMAEYEQGLALYRAGDFPQAIQKLGEAKAAGLNDHLTQEYIRRCEQLQTSPPEDWAGIYTLKDK